jgi:uncharacterized membrane protein YfcA
MEINSIILLFAAGISAGFINVNAGGGSALTLPILLFLGLDGAAANGTNRIAILIQNISAVSAFKQEKFQNFYYGLKMAAITLPGAIAGAIFAVNINDLWFKRILSLIMIGIIFTIIKPRSFKNKLNDDIEKIPVNTYITLFAIGFYGGFIQIGVGFLIMTALYNQLRLRLTRVNMYKVTIILIYTIPALLIFTFTQNINWVLGLILATGNAAGGWIGAKMAIKKGDRLIRYILILAIILMAVKLLFT